MIRAGEGPDDTQSGSTSVDTKPGLGLGLPKQRAGVVEDETAAARTDRSLATLVRQWVTTSEQVERQARSADDDSPLQPTWTPPKEDVQLKASDPAPAVEHSPKETPVAPDDPAHPAAQVARIEEAQTDAPRLELPRRRQRPQARPTRRLAVLIDADTASAESADALFELLADQGTVSVCRAYADWTSPEAKGWWSAPLRLHGIQPYHQFGHAQDQRALVALTIDAVDLARESAVDAVVIVGDLVSLYPLVVRLNASGLQVLAFGTTATPPDVRSLCHEFVDLSTLEPRDAVPAGKHRA